MAGFVHFLTAAVAYSVLGRVDYFAQDIANPNFESKYGVTGTLIAGAVPEPETYAMLLAGLGLMGTIVHRRKSRQIL